MRATLKELQLVPEEIAEGKKGAEAIKRILGNFAQLTQGLAELRNLYGSGHGRDSSRRGLQPRHARLAVSGRRFRGIRSRYFQYADSPEQANELKMDMAI